LTPYKSVILSDRRERRISPSLNVARFFVAPDAARPLAPQNDGNKLILDPNAIALSDFIIDPQVDKSVDTW
jgi:hypothetical protein